MKTPQILTGQQAIDQFGLNALIECRVAITTELNGLGHSVMQIGVIADPDNCFIDLSDEPAVLYVEIGQDEDSSLYPIMADEQFVLLDDKNQPASNEVLARRVVELTETVTVLGNQLAAKPSDSGYQALIHERDILKADKERLEAQVKRFADAYIHLLGIFGAIPAKAATDVILERKRQFNIEGWSHEHDDQHDTGELAAAASCYANYTQAYPESSPPPHWPWSKDWWKPKDKRSNLVRAGALILAEIERLDRSTKGAN